MVTNEDNIDSPLETTRATNNGNKNKKLTFTECTIMDAKEKHNYLKHSSNTEIHVTHKENKNKNEGGR